MRLGVDGCAVLGGPRELWSGRGRSAWVAAVSALRWGVAIRRGPVGLGAVSLLCGWALTGAPRWAARVSSGAVTRRGSLRCSRSAGVP